MRDARYGDVKGEVPPLFVTPALQDSAPGGLAFYVRGAQAPERLLRAVPAAVARVDRALPVAMLKTMPQQVRDNVFLDRMVGALAAAFAGLATLLAVVGLYGVLAYTLARRTREIGVRMALGAHAGRVRGLVLGQVAGTVAAGGAAGLAAALVIGRVVRSQLFGLDGHDPRVVAAAAAVLAAAALAAACVPAWRASRVAPVTALRGQ
jgi:ABC-type antimicrobial peptide transport system permease subunit